MCGKHQSGRRPVRIVIEDVLAVTMNGRKEVGRRSIITEGDRIRTVEQGPVRKRPGDLVIDGRRRIAIPGMVNGHVHCDITLARGLADGLTLFEQDRDSAVSRRRWFREELDREARNLSRILQYVEAVKGGTTFICDVPFWWYGDDLVAPFDAVGISGAVVLDFRKDFLTGEMVERKSYFEAAEQLRGHGLLPIAEAPAEEGFEDGLLLRLKAWAQDLDTFIHLHLAETTWRLGIVRERFGTSPARYLRNLGFLDDRVIGSHGVYLDARDRSVLSESGARIVNCPAAEMKIADGIAPFVELMQIGVPLGLGTDGALWNDASDLFSEMKTLMLLQRVAKGAGSIGGFDCLHAATIGGAGVFGMEGEIGSIEEGKRGSLVLIDLDRPHLVPLHHGRDSNVYQLLTSCARASDVDTVIVDGRIVVEGGHLRTLDEATLIDRCQALAESRFHIDRSDGAVR
jgi:5-methylthioadenosine/S-adenosylhomocysteine deaminase